MNLIGAEGILGLLRYLSVFVRREQFGADRSREYLAEHLAELASPLVRNEIDEISHERLGHGAVDSVHAHVVAVVGGPAQGQLGQVAGADDQSAVLIGDVHEHLGPLPGLAVFKGDVMVLHALSDVGEMSPHRLGDVDDLQRGTHPLRQQLRV